MSTRDEVTLSAKERQQLARLQSCLASADPRLANLLAGEQGSRAGPVDGLRRRAVLRAQHLSVLISARPWAGPALAVGGFALVMATLSWFVWLAIPAALVAAAGLGFSFRMAQPHLAARLAAMSAATHGPGAAGPVGGAAGGTGDGSTSED